MQMILERTEIHESGKLADFGAALTTADAQALQEVLSTLTLIASDCMLMASDCILIASLIRRCSRPSP
jgi:hypothetical protein